MSFYSQEARPTVLWIPLTLFSCIALLRARRINTASAWQVSAIVNQSEKPLVISDHFFIQVFSLSHELKPETSYSLIASPGEGDRWELPQVRSGYSDTFLFRPSEKLLAGMKQQFKVKPVIQDLLWKLQKN
jgi:hypothetical protein